MNYVDAQEYDLKILNDYISDIYPGEITESSDLYESINYSLLSGGKRVRPFIMIEIANMFGIDKLKMLPVASSLEMVHTSSLIHDDLPCMDNSDYRRGKLSNHKVFGYSGALLAGDALIVDAFYLINTSTFSDEIKVKLVSMLSYCAGSSGMIAGQVMDLKMAGNEEAFDREYFEKMEYLKTGMMFKAACLMGCICAGYYSDSVEYAKIEKFADNIGKAFQLIDDILDDDMNIINNSKKYELAKELTDKAVTELNSIENSDVLTCFANNLLDRKI